jgi:soluble lytic murein transglycosylase-like protein
MKRPILLLVTMVLCSPAAAWAFGDWFAHLTALETAADKGDIQALTQLAQKYEHGEGVPKDFSRANHLYCKAAKAGYPEAQFKLGWIYANGRGVEKDDGVAAKLFAMAAEQGHEHAGKLLDYVRKNPDAQMPFCMRPDPPVAQIDESLPIPRVRAEIEQLVQKLAPQYAIDPRLVLAVISAESAFNPKAVSPKNAQGLMQLIPQTAERFGVKQVFIPAENIKGGMAYLRWLLAFFQGDVSLVLAAYNAGERAVERYRGIPPYAETQNYVKKITKMYQRSSHPFQADVVDPSPIVVRPQPSQK